MIEHLDFGKYNLYIWISYLVTFSFILIYFFSFFKIQKFLKLLNNLSEKKLEKHDT